MTYIVSLPNPGTEGKPKFLRNGDVAARWLEAENRPGFGIYYSPNPLKPGATTHGKDIDAIAMIFVDIDFKGVVETPEEIFKVLTEMQHLLAPSFIVESGHGYHVGYVLKEPVRHDDPDFERVCDMQEVLISYLAADPAVRPWSLLRLPGTLNSKLEPHVQCREIVRGAPVDLTEVTDLCEIIKGTAALTYKEKPAGNGSGAGTETGERPGVDADSELASIQHGNINNTWSRVMGSELRKGTPADDIYRQILTATQNSPACHSDPGRGKWTSSLANMMTRYIRDNREFALKTYLRTCK